MDDGNVINAGVINDIATIHSGLFLADSGLTLKWPETSMLGRLLKKCYREYCGLG